MTAVDWKAIQRMPDMPEEEGHRIMDGLCAREPYRPLLDRLYAHRTPLSLDAADAIEKLIRPND